MGKALKGVPEQPREPPDGVVSVRINPRHGLRDDTERGCPTTSCAEFTPRKAQDALAPAARHRSGAGARCPQPAVLMAIAQVAAGPIVASTASAVPAAVRERRTARDRRLAARLIAEHGVTDWSLAKRKAARATDAARRARPLPGDDEIEQALRDYHALFGGARAGGVAARASATKRCAGCAPGAVRAAAGRRRRGGLGDRAQRHPPRARRRRPEGGRAGADQRGVAYRGAPRMREHAAAELYVDTPARRRAPRRAHAATARQRPRRDRQRREATAARLQRSGGTARSLTRSLRQATCSALAQPARRVEREVGQDRVGAGALDADQRLRARRRARRASRACAAAFSIAYSPVTW